MSLFGGKKENLRSLDSYKYPEQLPSGYEWETVPAFGTDDPLGKATHHIKGPFDVSFPPANYCVECRKSGGTCVGKHSCDVSCLCRASGGCGSRYGCC